MKKGLVKKLTSILLTNLYRNFHEIGKEFKSFIDEIMAYYNPF